MRVGKDVTYDRVYYVVDQDAPNASPSLAIRPRIIKTDNNERSISWENTTKHEMKFKCSSIEYMKYVNQEVFDPQHPPKEIKITTDNDKVLVLRRLTREVYNNMNNVANKPAFETDDELQRHYIEYDFEAEAYKKMFG